MPLPLSMLLYTILSLHMYAADKLVPPEGKIVFGAWLDTSSSPVSGGDSHAGFNKRIGFNAGSFQIWQDLPPKPPKSDTDFGNHNSDGNIKPSVLDDGTTASLFLTIHPLDIDNGPPNRSPYENYWSGAEYVDWVGISVYWKALRRNILGCATWTTLWHNSLMPEDPSPFIKTAFHLGTVDASGNQNPLDPEFLNSFLFNPKFFTQYPLVKMVFCFEVYKVEDVDTMNDYRATHDSDTLAALAHGLKQLDANSVVEWASQSAHVQSGKRDLNFDGMEQKSSGLLLMVARVSTAQPIIPAAVFVPSSANTLCEPSNLGPQPSPPTQTGSFNDHFTVINQSSIRLQLSLEFVVYSSFAQVASNQSQNVSLQGFTKCFASLSQSAGVILVESEDGSWATWVRERSATIGIWVKPNQVLIFVNDPINPPFSLPEYKAAESLIQRAIEDSPQPNSDDVWTEIAEILGRPNKDAVKDRYFNSFRRPSPWTEIYDPVKVLPNVSRELICSAIKAGTFQVHSYWRSLDSFPGGNSEFVTSKYVFSFTRKDLQVECTAFENWDGTHVLIGPYSPRNATILDKSHEFQALLADLVAESNEETASVSLNWTCHKLDTLIRSGDDHNSEWSSQELLLYIPIRWSPSTCHLFSHSARALFKTLALVNLRVLSRLPREILWLIMDYSTQEEHKNYETGGGNGSLVMRLHQQTRFGPQLLQWAIPEDADSAFVKPTPKQRELLEMLNQEVGIGRPVQWTGTYDFSDEFDGRVSRAGADCLSSAERVSGHWNDFGYSQPIYFRW
ncbi:UNVERIFIED_CONTAM: hypothetical protein HDU68_009708 [Siphonaria sp. JEL0065]|nr:hypothetical protein HDU68_009708 [Siphonaria sp. JEL0065]